MPSEDDCARLINTSIVTDVVDIITGFVPVVDEAARNITDQIQLNTEMETLSIPEFNEYRRYYALPATIRALMFCKLRKGLPLPELHR